MPSKIYVDKNLLYKYYIEDNYPKQKILSLLNISKSTLYRNIKELELRRSHSNIGVSLEDILTRDFLFEEYVIKQKTIETIALQLGIANYSVHRYLKKFKINRNYFEANKVQQYQQYNFKLLETWCPDTAYILGFFAADGCMQKPTTSGGYQLSFAVSVKTLPVLKYLSNTIGGNIRHYKKYDKKRNWEGDTYVLIWNCHYLYDYFKNIYGFTPKKSFTVQIPPSIPDNLFVYFLRGLLDGDGCVFNYGGTYGLSFCSGSKSFLEAIVSYLQKINIQHSGINKLKNIWCLTFYCQKGRLFGTFLYNDVLKKRPKAFYLDYKYQKFLEFYK